LFAALDGLQRAVHRFLPTLCLRTPTKMGDSVSSRGSVSNATTGSFVNSATTGNFVNSAPWIEQHLRPDPADVGAVHPTSDLQLVEGTESV